MGKGTIYQYFKDKNELFFQVATSGFEELCELLRQRVPSDAPFAEQLVDVCNEILRFFEGRRQLFRMMQSEDARMRWCKGETRKRWTENRHKLEAAVALVIKGGVSEGAIRSDIAPDILASFLLGLLRTRAHRVVQAPESAEPLKVLVDLFCYGAGRRGTEAVKE